MSVSTNHYPVKIHGFKSSATELVIVLHIPDRQCQLLLSMEHVPLLQAEVLQFEMQLMSWQSMQYEDIHAPGRYCALNYLSPLCHHDGHKELQICSYVPSVIFPVPAR